MTRFVVIENTPGYLPENATPFTTDSYEDAVAAANELANYLVRDHDYEIEDSYEEVGNYYAIKCWLPDVEHDLGRVIEVKQYEEEA